MDHTDYRRDGRARSSQAVPMPCSTRSCHPASRRSSSCSTSPDSLKQGGSLICTYFDENFLNLVPAEHVEGLYSCLDYYQQVGDPFSKALLASYNELYPGDAMFTAGSACTGMYRGLKLWESAVRKAGFPGPGRCHRSARSCEHRARTRWPS